MSSVNFSKGTLDTMPVVISEGNIYAITDQESMYIDVTDTQRIKISDVIYVDTEADLPLPTEAIVEKIYLVTDTLTMYKSDSLAWEILTLSKTSINKLVETYVNNTAVLLEGNQTIDGIKVFRQNITSDRFEFGTSRTLAVTYGNPSVDEAAVDDMPLSNKFNLYQLKNQNMDMVKFYYSDSTDNTGWVDMSSTFSTTHKLRLMSGDENLASIVFPLNEHPSYMVEVSAGDSTGATSGANYFWLTRAHIYGTTTRNVVSLQIYGYDSVNDRMSHLCPEQTFTKINEFLASVNHPRMNFDTRDAIGYYDKVRYVFRVKTLSEEAGYQRMLLWRIKHFGVYPSRADRETITRDEYGNVHAFGKFQSDKTPVVPTDLVNKQYVDSLPTHMVGRFMFTNSTLSYDIGLGFAPKCVMISTQNGTGALSDMVTQDYPDRTKNVFHTSNTMFNLTLTDTGFSVDAQNGDTTAILQNPTFYYIAFS